MLRVIIGKPWSLDSDVLKRFSSFSIRIKLLTSAILVLLPISAFIYWYFPSRESDIAFDAIHSRTANMAEFVALGVGRGLHLNDFSDIATAVNWVKQDPTLAYMVVTDSSGAVIANFNPGAQPLDMAPTEAPKSFDVRDDVLAATVPIYFEGIRVGTLLLGVSLVPMHELIDAERTLALFIGLAVFVMGGAVSWYFALRITSPIMDLRIAADAVAHGNYEVALPRVAKDEIGDLSNDFRVMVDNLRNSRESLTHLVNELAGARDEAMASDRAKAYFLATMSHEIRTPMNGVMGMLELLNATELTARQRRFTDTAYRSAESLLDVINEILDFSKIEAGHLELHRTSFDLCQTVEDICEMLAPKAHEKGIDLVTRISPELHHSVHGDVIRIRQVLVNLLGNAVKFTSRGTVQISVTVSERTDQRQFVCFEVTDSGIGISPEVVSSLFRPFVQADSTTTRRFGGTGLGLAIAQQLVRLMGGEISIVSTLGFGSTFAFTVPLDLRPIDTSSPLTAVQALAGRRILVVDDNALNREMLREQLGAWGATIDEAEDGPQALIRLGAVDQPNKYDVVILDFTMPEMDGGVVARKIRANPAWKSMPILLLSSVGGTAQALESAAPVDAVLTKPARQRELAERLVALVREGRNFDGAASASSRTRSGKVPLDFGGMRVLLAEDNPVNQSVAIGFLNGFGCHVTLASTGVEAVREATSQCFDLILMDCMMPEMDGYEATHAIRKFAAVASPTKIPIVALTASALDGERERCLAAGMDDYLSKPFRLDQLVQVLTRWGRPRIPTSGTTDDIFPPTADHVTDPVTEIVASVLDQDALASILSFPGGARILSDSVNAYHRVAPTQIRELREAIETGRREDVHRIAHTLKSSSAMLGVSHLADLLRQMEQVAKSADDSELTRLCRSAECAFDAGCNDLQVYVTA